MNLGRTRFDLMRPIKRLAVATGIALALIAAVLGPRPTTGLAGAATTPCQGCVRLLFPDLVGSARLVIQRGADFEPHYVLAVTVTNTGKAAAPAFGVTVVTVTAKPVSLLAQFSSSGLDAGAGQTFFKPLTRDGFR